MREVSTAVGNYTLDFQKTFNCYSQRAETAQDKMTDLLGLLLTKTKQGAETSRQFSQLRKPAFSQGLALK